MSTRAQYYLEQALPELLDLKRKGVFDEREVQAIARKRTGYEEALARKVVRKQDFLRYVEYETNLEALRRSRINSRQVKDTKKSISDWAGTRRILFIYERATTKFHGDIELWLQYIDCARQQKATKQLARIFAKVLQLHPRSAALWIAAADHEWSHNGNIVAARNLALKALRLNDDNGDLIVWYYRLELRFAAQLVSRRQVLGLSTGALEQVDDEEDFTSEAELDADEIALTVAEDAPMAPADATQRIMDGTLPLVLLRKQASGANRQARLWQELYDTTLAFGEIKLAAEMLDLCRDMLVQVSKSDTRVALHDINRAALAGSDLGLLTAIQSTAARVCGEIECGNLTADAMHAILQALGRLQPGDDDSDETVEQVVAHFRSHLVASWLDANPQLPGNDLFPALCGKMISASDRLMLASH